MQDLVPFMVNHQRRIQKLSAPLQPAGSLSPVQSAKDSNAIPDSLSSTSNMLIEPAIGIAEALTGSTSSITCHAYIAAQDCYCARANNLHAYADVNRCVICPLAICLGFAWATNEGPCCEGCRASL